jgi:hypothetical protein
MIAFLVFRDRGNPAEAGGGLGVRFFEANVVSSYFGCVVKTGVHGGVDSLAVYFRGKKNALCSCFNKLVDFYLALN